MIRAALAAIGLLLVASPALGFGAAGHHAVCDIAYRDLTPEVRVRVDEILQAEGDDRFFSFGAACGWPDSHNIFGPIIRMYARDHYINVPRDAGEVSKCFDRDGETDRCLLTAIPKMIRVLQGRDLERLGQREAGYPLGKTEALRFLGHWLGDIHQPLHVSYADDRGGNSVPVFGVEGCSGPDKRDVDQDGDTHEQVSNLHSIWDVCIVHASMAERGFGSGTGKRSAYAADLHAEISWTQRTLWAGVLERAGWPAAIATESHALAQDALVQYCIVANRTCRYSSDAVALLPGATPRILQLSETYEDLHRATVEAQLKKAGVRLGALLNDILG